MIQLAVTVRHCPNEKVKDSQLKYWIRVLVTSGGNFLDFGREGLPSIAWPNYQEEKDILWARNLRIFMAGEAWSSLKSKLDFIYEVFYLFVSP